MIFNAHDYAWKCTIKNPHEAGFKSNRLHLIIVIQNEWFDSNYFVTLIGTYKVFSPRNTNIATVLPAGTALTCLLFEPENSTALGFGFRCGFLGLLHMEIVQERLEREYDMDLITTAPTVVYELLLKDGTVEQIENPSRLPDMSRIEEIREPVINVNLLMPQDYVGPVMTLCNNKRGIQKNMQYMGRQVMLSYEMPLNEVVLDFFDKLKSVSRGYASMDYEFLEFRAADLVKLDIMVNGERVDALSLIVHRANSRYRGGQVAEKMRELIPRQMFDVAIQASIGANIIARETVKAMRKNVIAKCYGGDVSRKRKLLDKQKEGKKRMKQVGNVEIPQEAFLAILRVEDK